MIRLHTTGILLVVLLGSLQLNPQVVAQDALATWLEDNGLQRLLVRRLEQELESARSAPDRTAIAQSLAETYASLLDSIPPGPRRDELESRGRTVLGMIDRKEGDPLRLALLRSSYSAATRQCELHRLVLDTPDTIESLSERLTEIATELSEVRMRLARNELALERRINRTRGIQAQILGARSDTLGLRIAQSTYLEAWSRAYLAWMNADRVQALESQKLFGQILATGDAFPAPADISIDLRSNEIYAESILGIAFAKSMTDSTATVRIWLELLESIETAPYVRATLPYWRLALLADTGAYGEVLEVLRGLPEDAPVSWLRLAAVLGLGSDQVVPASRTLGTEAVALLAARGELAQVVDLAERFNLSDMERDGFALHYVSGVCRYDDARVAVESGDLISARSIYRAALDDLDAALAEPDRDDFTDAVPGVVAMRAWCLHELGRFDQASIMFDEAASLHSGMDAGNYLWMAISSLDKLEQSGGADGFVLQRQADLIERFLADHPAHPSAPNALLRRFASIKNPTLEDAEVLVMVPATSAMGARAHQQGVQMLYRIFNRGTAEERLPAGLRFLDVVPVPRFESQDSEEEHQIGILRVRQILDVALNKEISRLEVARDAIAAIDRGVVSGVIEIEGRERELDYRRMCLALLDGDVSEALHVFGLLESGDDDWTQVAARTLYNAARVVMVDDQPNQGDPRIQYGIDAVRRAALVLLGPEPADADFSEDRLYRIGRTLALAERRAWESNRNVQALERAHNLHLALAEIRARDQKVLAGLAWSAEQRGDDDRALAALRTLVSGSSVDSDDWYRHKHELIRLLVQVDPERARKVLDQHIVLHPEYGPEPWGDRFRALHATVGRQGGGS
jgi:tetratricopeptide (TPR) repeat protein